MKPQITYVQFAPCHNPLKRKTGRTGDSDPLRGRPAPGVWRTRRTKNHFDGQDFEVESYLRYRGNQFVTRFDPNSYLYITKAIETLSERNMTFAMLTARKVSVHAATIFVVL